MWELLYSFYQLFNSSFSSLSSTTTKVLKPPLNIVCSVTALFIILKGKEQERKKARHLSHYLVKLDRTGKVHRDPDSFLLLPLFCGFPLRPHGKQLQMKHIRDSKFMCGTTALLGSLPPTIKDWKSERNTRQSESTLPPSKSITCHSLSERPGPTIGNKTHTKK